MTTGDAPICMKCKHFDPNASTLVCKAYPQGIPEVILESIVDHTKPYAGDGGIVFEPVKAKVKIVKKEKK